MLGYTSRFQLGPGSTGKIQARFSGPDRRMVRELASQAQAILEADPDSKAVRTEWREQVKVVRPVLAEEQANLNGITRTDVANVLLQGFQGRQVGIYREGDLLLPIILRAEAAEREDIASMSHLQIWSPAAQISIPLRQVVSGFETVFEDEIIERRNRKPTNTVYADPGRGWRASCSSGSGRRSRRSSCRPATNWSGAVNTRTSADAQAGLKAGIPMFLALMMLITIVLFNSLKQPLMIWLTVPLALIGVTAGLLVTGQPFGFMALLGFLSLSGMLIKNAIVLIDEINLQLREGRPLLMRSSIPAPAVCGRWRWRPRPPRWA